MKGSEALLRAIASAGGDVSSLQFDRWISQLLKAGLLEKDVREDDDPFHYKLTEKSKIFLRKKGVNI